MESNFYGTDEAMFFPIAVQIYRETQRKRDQTQIWRTSDSTKTEHRHTDTQTHRHTDTQTHRHTDTQTHRGKEEGQTGPGDWIRMAIPNQEVVWFGWPGL